MPKRGNIASNILAFVTFFPFLVRKGHTAETASEKSVCGEGAGCVEGIGVDLEGEDTGEDKETAVEVPIG